METKEELHKQLKRLEQENAELKKYEYYYLDKFIDFKKALEEIREIAGIRFVSGINEEADAYNQDMSRIYNKINEVLK